MIDGDGPFVFWDFSKDFFGVRLIWEDELEVTFINFLGADKSRKHSFSSFDTELIFSVYNNLRGEYFETNQDILVQFHMGMWGGLIRARLIGEVDIYIGAVVSIVKELFYSFFDNGYFLLVSSFERILNRFGLDV